jgi:hypothetical protein
MSTYKTKGRDRAHRVGVLLFDYIDNYSSQHGYVPTFEQMRQHLTEAGEPTANGGVWRQSSVQALLAKYCKLSGKPYPARRFKRKLRAGDDEQEVTITIKLLVNGAAHVVNVAY